MPQIKRISSLVVNPLIIFLVSFLLAVLVQWLMPMAFISLKSAQIIGLALMAAGFLLGLAALIKLWPVRVSFDRKSQVTTLIQTGPYRFTRNPIYLGMVMMFTGLVVFLNNPWGLLFIPVLIWLTTIWAIQSEENQLESLFGAKYIEYKRTVHRWI